MIELPVLQPSPEPESGASSNQTRFWRSIEHLEGSAGYSAFTGSELMPEASGSPGQTSRRGFLHIMGASMALAGLSACRKPVEYIMPFARRPEDTIPGVPMQYATGMEFRGTLIPVVVESTDGRPTKVEGNSEHPESSGSSGVFEQASLLDLYDPDRSQVVMRDSDPSTWADFVRFAAGRDRSERIAVLAAPSSSITMGAVRQRLASGFQGSRWVEYDAVGTDTSAAAMQQAYGRALRPRLNLERASVIVSLDADFLSMTHPDGRHNTAGFAAGRRVDKGETMSRLYVAESAFSVTGGVADHRKAVRSSDIPEVAGSIARALGMSVPGGTAHDDHDWVHAVADDLRAAGPAGVVVAGENQPVFTHLVAAAINEMLGAVGQTVDLLEDASVGMGATRTAELQRLVADMRGGSIDLLVMLGANPAYDAPADLGFVEAMASVPETVHVGLHRNETAAASRWHVPMTHYLEAWGDGRAFGGTASVVQPLIAPLYAEAHSAIEVAALFADGSDQSGYDLVRSTWQGALSGPFEAAWRKALHDGFSAGGFPSFSAMNGAAGRAVASATVPAASPGLELVFRTSSSTLDGSFANNAWLQELPDPATKIVWDNVAMMSPATAERLGLGVGLSGGAHYVDVATLSVDGRSADVPVWIMHGVADDSIQLELGYGRSIATDRPTRASHFFDLDHETDIYASGAISSGVGANVAVLRSVTTLGVAGGASATRSGGDYLIATTQDHGALPDEGAETAKRGLFRMATVAEYRADPTFVSKGDPKIIDDTAWEDYAPLWDSRHPTGQDAAKDNPYFANQWGMVIDLNTCTGCNACVVACQAENNVQVVGKEEVSRGREMHWIRMDRYFVGGDGQETMMVQQPLPCMHCENAPCEQVCPVAATVHSPDGTNQMIYNRCIGTRYCANNCPYKVRRFNYYNWTKTLPQTVHMAQNPNVTVRSRGVMEKCSYCIQRVREVNRQVNVENREIRDGDVVTACQQACPASAITFGDLNDPNSAVREKRSSPRRYEMLAELNVKPRTSYLARVRNPNTHLEPAVADATVDRH